MRQQEKKDGIDQPWLRRKYFKMGKIAVFLAFLLPFVIVGILKLMSLIPGQAFVIHDRIDTWFSFYGSYCGVFVSIILGVITLYLTEKLDSINKENNEKQVRYSIAANMPNMRCEELTLYSLEGPSIPRDILRFFEDRNPYILFLRMAPAFPPYFDVHLRSIELYFKNPRTGEPVSAAFYQFDEKNVRIMNNGEVQMTINIPEALTEIFRKLDMLKVVATDATKYEWKLAEIFLEIQCRNMLIVDSSMDVLFRLRLLVENIGDNKEHDGTCLKILTREFKEI